MAIFNRSKSEIFEDFSFKNCAFSNILNFNIFSGQNIFHLFTSMKNWSSSVHPLMIIGKDRQKDSWQAQGNIKCWVRQWKKCFKSIVKACLEVLLYKILLLLEIQKYRVINKGWDCKDDLKPFKYDDFNVKLSLVSWFWS